MEITAPEVHDARPEHLAAGVATAIERLIGLFRSLSPPNGLSLTAAATLATLERSGPSRLTSLAVKEGVTQPAMTQLIGRLQESGLVNRDADPTDGRVVQVRLTDEGRAMLARRRAVRAERLTEILARLSPDEQAALATALPAMDALANAQQAGPPLGHAVGVGAQLLPDQLVHRVLVPLAGQLDQEVAGVDAEHRRQQVAVGHVGAR
jgi:DNA-binding MarR family transcriptional regulator